jgi:hypothetical protein
MPQVLRDLIGSKKFLAALGAGIVYIAGRFGLHVDPDALDRLFAALLVYVGAQGIADQGKSAAEIHAAVATRTIPMSDPASISPAAQLADEMKRGVARFVSSAPPGRTRAGVMLALAVAGIGGALLLGGCTWTAAHPKTTAIGAAGVSCTLGSLAESARGYQPVAEAAVGGTVDKATGTVDTPKLLTVLESAIVDGLRCALVTAVAKLATPAPVTPAATAVQGLIGGPPPSDPGPLLLRTLAHARQSWGGAWTGPIATSAGGV